MQIRNFCPVMLFVAMAAAEPKKIASYSAENDFIDDPIAFSPDGKKLAFIVTDGATHSVLRIVNPGETGPGTTLTYSSITPERIDFLDSDRLLMVERNPETHLARAQLFTTRGPARERLGPADDIVLSNIAGVPAVITYLRSPKGHGFVHTLVAYRRDTLKLFARRVLEEGENGRIAVAGAAVKPQVFLRGYAELVGQREGTYDAAHDVRKPDRATRIDVFASKQLEEQEIGDLIDWAKRMQVRRKHINESDFVRVPEDLRELQLFDSKDAVHTIALPRPFKKYEPGTLVYQGIDDKQLVFSLTIDPVNAEAVAAQKADRDWVDLYRIDLASHVLTELARLDGEKRPSSWRLSGQRLGLLRKHKGFGRGGPTLDVYDL